MADWSMEPAAVWMPCDLQLANWTMDPAVCAPGFPAEYACTEVFGSCYQTSVAICEGGKRCEYEVDTQYNPIETAKLESVVDIHNMEMIIPSEEIRPQNPTRVFRGVADECNDDIDRTRNKMHRYPASLSLDERYTAPKVVAIGPYHRGPNHRLEKAEKMKHVADYQCISDSACSVQQMYDAVVPVAQGVRSLYDKDVVAGMDDDDFLPMMFYDACFLVQYMHFTSSYDSAAMEKSLSSFFNTNDNEIFHDIMLLENQLPWPVVETIMTFRHVPLETFISSLKGCLQDCKRREEKQFVMDGSYKPPHLLGLLRFYIVRNSMPPLETHPDSGDQLSLSVGASELAEIGICLKQNKNTGLVHMGVETKMLFPLISGKLFLAPLSLDDARASFLVTMAALELCTASNFQDAKKEDSAVCSYLLLLATLVAREEDVQKLRTQHILLGGGLSNREVLDLFTRLHGLRLGSCYVHTMIQIQRHTSKTRTRTKCYAFWYKNKQTIIKVASIIGSAIGVIVTIKKAT